jgi:hypothetical protein
VKEPTAATEFHQLSEDPLLDILQKVFIMKVLGVCKEK